MRNFWVGFLVAAVVAILAVYLGRPYGEAGGGGKGKIDRRVEVLVYMYNDPARAGECKVIVGPERVEARRSDRFEWVLRNDCGAHPNTDAIDVSDFREKGSAECKADTSQPAPKDRWPVEDQQSDTKVTKKKVKDLQATGQWCYSVYVKYTGGGGQKHDPEMDIMQ